MKVKVQDVVIDTDFVLAVSKIYEATEKLKYDRVNEIYVNNKSYYFKIMIATGDIIIVTNENYIKLNNIKTTFENKLNHE